MSNTLAGYPPGDPKPRIAAINIPADIKKEVEYRFAQLGWTGLTWNKPIREEDDTDDTDATGTSRPA